MLFVLILDFLLLRCCSDVKNVHFVIAVCDNLFLYIIKYCAVLMTPGRLTTMPWHCARKLRLTKYLFSGEPYYYHSFHKRSVATNCDTVLGSWNGRSIKVLSGKYARLADSSVVAECENTAVMVTVVGKPQSNPSNFLPLTVDFRQKTAAYGRIPTNFFRRDRGASEQEILTGRLVDRSIRPLFPASTDSEMQVTCNILSIDERGDPEVLAINATSSALALSSLPWNGPVGAVRVCSVDNEIVINPPRSILKKSALNILLVGFNSSVVMMDLSSTGVSTSLLFSAIKKGVVECETISAKIRNLVTLYGKPKREASEIEKIDTSELDECVQVLCQQRIKNTFLNFSHDKQSRDVEITEILSWAVNVLIKENPSFVEHAIKNSYYHLVKKTFRELIMEEELRCDGRQLNEVRPISCETGLYKPLHGSAVFQRGQTQVLCTVALDSHETALKLDPYSQLTSGLKEKNFFLHYEFPQYAVNDIQRGPSVGRREYGHGALAERALRPVIPKDYPFTIRLTSEVLESNGSSSMATVCGGTLALLDAGVPIKSPVSGVAMGIITKTSSDNPQKIVDYRIMTDLSGIEDHFGDMDFKVSCSGEGITAAQLDMKIPGLAPRILFQALLSAVQANNNILKIMKNTLANPRVRDDGTLPVVETLEIPQSKLGKVLGVGGHNIRRMLLETGAHLTHLDGYQYSLFAPNSQALKDAKQFIESTIGEKDVPELEFGCIYTAKIAELRDSGVLVSLYESMVPQFVPNSQLDLRKVSHPSALGLSVGQEIQLKYFGRDPASGNMRLSRKVLQGPSGMAHNLDRVNSSQSPSTDAVSKDS